ncbi:growth/differentiation factor 10-like [Scleropages formosus]|uniref:Growth/differentiation factor 10 n=1 Tax=Scleropages formosus TaxID=113540 RepID=A0A8C9RFS8_SCLFO|nr:growth/differentiation factor 10 [Scleropages formosus]
MAPMLVFLVHVFLSLGCGASEETVRDNKRSVHPGLGTSSDGLDDGDPVSAHMFKLYDKYSRDLYHSADGNTVRSFKATSDALEQKALFQFNLSSVQESEVVISATFHIFFDLRLRQRSWFCKRLKTPACHVQLNHPLPLVHLLFRGTSPNFTAGQLLANLTLAPHRRGAWLTRDISDVVKAARATDESLVTVELDFEKKSLKHQGRISQLGPPYILVYADDLSISEPNSVAATLQRYDPSAVGEEPTLSPNASPDGRVRRDARLSQPILDNELPEVEHSAWKNQELWESSYLAPKPKPLAREAKRQGQEEDGSVEDGGMGLGAPQVLSFDEKTMRKARRRQWSEPRVCARRYLRVDFADIGWSEWVLAPKAFDAYYCAGPCGFPIPKVVRPSNHATIQSIVRAVGITPGVPEPCCVPDKTSALSVLFLDEGRNMVLKVYPGMSVETCSCR